MNALTIKVNENAQPAVFTPKLNYGFYTQTRDDKALSKDGQDGFSALVNGLLDGNVDMIVAFYYHALAWYKRNQPSETAVVDALEDTIFKDEETTDKAFDEIIKELQTVGFLARKLDEFIKKNDKTVETMENQIASMEDGRDKEQFELGITQINTTTTKLQTLMTSQESSPKPEE